MTRQEESRSISNNVTWGQRKQFVDGKVSLSYKQFLGYEKGENGLLKIEKNEAGVIRMIYKLFLDGKTTSGIGCLSGKIVCGECGSFYGNAILNSKMKKSAPHLTFMKVA